MLSYVLLRWERTPQALTSNNMTPQLGRMGKISVIDKAGGRVSHTNWKKNAKFIQKQFPHKVCKWSYHVTQHQRQHSLSLSLSSDYHKSEFWRWRLKSSRRSQPMTESVSPQPLQCEIARAKRWRFFIIFMRTKKQKKWKEICKRAISATALKSERKRVFA